MRKLTTVVHAVCTVVLLAGLLYQHYQIRRLQCDVQELKIGKDVQAQVNEYILGAIKNR